ncbi:MAG: hypothetical protein U1F76_06590 [Candidatus Competibacteraceae bacterium]
MDTIEIIAFPANEGELKSQPLPLPGAGSRCTVELRNLPGASHIHLLLMADGAVKFRAEIPAQARECVQVEIGLDENGTLQVQCPGRSTVLLPENPLLPPLDRPIYMSGSKESVELAIVIDGTSRIFSRGQEGAFTSSLLLADKERWTAQVEKLCRFIETLSQYCKECRIAVLAFGDQPIPNVTAPDLQARYRIYPPEPEKRLLQLLTLQQIKSQLFSIPATSGGDFVDALADALAACNELYWSPDARKLVLISGDSPGFSILQPIPKGGDACVRENDVDTQTLRLHRRGVELLTVYHDPDPDFLDSLIEPQREFQKYAQEQYTRLASLPEMAFVASQFDGLVEAEAFRHLSGYIGRGGTYGELVEIVDRS